MTFFVVFVALLIERFFDWSHLREWHWFFSYDLWLEKRLSHQIAYLRIALLTIPIALIVFLTNLLLGNFFYGVLSLAFQAILLLYCFGPQNIWADAYTSLHSLGEDTPRVASDRLKLTFGVTNSRWSLRKLHEKFLEALFIEGHRRVFAPLFWYLLLGPTGAIFYRLITLLASPHSRKGILPDTILSAEKVESVLDWASVRVFTLLFALGGHFVQVFSYWGRYALTGLDNNQILLTECGLAALDETHSSSPSEEGSLEKSAISLLDRVFIIMLIVIGLGFLSLL